MKQPLFSVGDIVLTPHKYYPYCAKYVEYVKSHYGSNIDVNDVFYVRAKVIELCKTTDGVIHYLVNYPNEFENNFFKAFFIEGKLKKC